MKEKINYDRLLDKISIALIVLYGLVLIINQFQYARLSSSATLNLIGILLVLVLIGTVLWLLLDKHIEESGKERYLEHIPASESKPLTFYEKLNISIVVVVAIMILFNQVVILQVSAMMDHSSGMMGMVQTRIMGTSTGDTISLGRYEFGSKITLKPAPLSSGENPFVAGYKTKVKSFPTISELELKPLTGDAAKDFINNIIPTGAPWYSQEAGGVTFDDPVFSQKRWGSYESLQLSSEEDQRWDRIVNSFTCDYCCGSPQVPTIITRCGCAHAAGARGMAKWFIKNYGDKLSDDEIYGEMARWYSLWYPAGTIKRIVLEM